MSCQIYYQERAAEDKVASIGVKLRIGYVGLIVILLKLGHFTQSIWRYICYVIT